MWATTMYNYDKERKMEKVEGHLMYIPPLWYEINETIPNVIGLTGYAGSGKDTVGALLRMVGYRRISFADSVKDEIRDFVNLSTADTLKKWRNHLNDSNVYVPVNVYRTLADGRLSPEMVYLKPTLPEVRSLLQWWGTEYRRFKDEDYWVNLALKKARSLFAYASNARVVFTDVRFPNEERAVRHLSKSSVVWRVVREGNYDTSHVSESSIDSVTVDRIVKNETGEHIKLAEEVLSALMSQAATGDRDRDRDETGMSLFAGVELVGRPDLNNVRKLDLSCLSMIRKMHARGIAVNREYLLDLSSSISAEMEDLKRTILSYIPASALDEFCTDTINIDSPEQISSVLFKHLRIGHGRELKLTKSGTRISSGKKQLEALRTDHPIIVPILQYRERAKLISTYTTKIPRIAKYDPATDTWRVRTNFGVTSTTTGRLNSSNPINLQNIPYRTDLGKRVRQGFVATPGFKLVSHDFSQIELRVLAHVANEREMIRIFTDDGDIHIDTCIRANGLTLEQYKSLPSKEQKDLRLPAKTCNFLVVYSGTGLGLQQALAVAGISKSVEWCDDFVDNVWHGLYPGVRPFMETQTFRAIRYGYVWDLFGRIRRIPQMQSVMRNIRSDGSREAGNMEVQATAGGIMKLAMAEVDATNEEYTRDGMEVHPLLAIHDQLVQEVREDYVEAYGYHAKVIFEGCCPLRVPVKCDWEESAEWKH